jgi:DNA-directed RNA polymerase specialized sigma24 family protein
VLPASRSLVEDGPVSTDQSVTFWIGQLKDGDAEAAQQLWQRYYARLVGLARQKLGALPRRAADEEDVALSAFHSFCGGVDKGRFPRLDDRDDLWQVLVTLAGWKASNLRKHEHALKRGGGRVRGDSAFLPDPAAATDAGIAQVVDGEPTPAFAAVLAEECQCRLDQLRDETLRRVAVLKMEGHTNEEIAQQLGCVVRTVERKLLGIRAIWSEEQEGD